MVPTGTFFLEVYSAIAPPNVMIEMITITSRIINTGIVKLCEITSREPVKNSPPGIFKAIFFHLKIYSKILLPLLVKTIPPNSKIANAKITRSMS